MSEGDELDALDLPPALQQTDDDELEAASGSDAVTEFPASLAGKDGDLAVPFTADFRNDRREFERRYIARCLEESGGNVTRAAAVLGMHRQSLQHKLRELGLGRRYVSVASDPQD